MGSACLTVQMIKGARYLLIIHEVLVAMGFFLQGCKMRP